MNIKKITAVLATLLVLFPTAVAYAAPGGTPTPAPATTPTPCDAANGCDPVLELLENNPALSLPDRLVKTVGGAISDVLDAAIHFTLLGISHLVAYTLFIVSAALFRMVFVVSIFLNIVIGFTILHMGELIRQGSDTGKAIAFGWTIFRDLANLGFIGGLIWASIAMVLQLGGTIKPGKVVSDIIIVALLVNFSYFFAGVIIDASNALSLQIYNAGIATSPESLATIIQHSTGSKKEGQYTNGYYDAKFSEIILSQTRIITMFNEDGLVTLRKAAERSSDFGEDLNLIFLFTLMTFLFSALIGAFMTISFLLITRFIILIFLLITAPIGMLYFSGLPEVSKLGRQWWTSLLHQCVFPPVFFLLVMTSFKVIGAFSKNTLIDNPVAVLSNLASLDMTKAGQAIDLLLIYAMALGFLWASAAIAKSIATESETKLPTGGDIQKRVLEFTQPVINFASKAPLRTAKYAFVDLPVRSTELLLRGLGKGPNLLGRIGRTKRREQTKEAEKRWRRLRARIPGRTERIEDIEREEKAKEKPLEDLLEAIDRVTYWENELKDAKTAEDRARATRELKAAKDDRKKAINDYYNKNGVEDFVKWLKAPQMVKDPVTKEMRPETKEEQAERREQALDALDEDKYQEVRRVEQGREPSEPKKEKPDDGGSTGGGKAASTPRAPGHAGLNLGATATPTMTSEALNAAMLNGNLDGIRTALGGIGTAQTRLVDIEQEELSTEHQELLYARYHERMDAGRARRELPLIKQALGEGTYRKTLNGSILPAMQPDLIRSVAQEVAADVTPQGYATLAARSDIGQTLTALDAELDKIGSVAGKIARSQPRGRIDIGNSRPPSIP